MTQNASHDAVLRPIRWPLRLTWAGIWAEAVLRAGWPLMVLALLAFAAQGFGLPGHLSLDMAWYGALAGSALLGLALLYARRHFRRPSRAAALARLDARLAGQPLASLRDTLAVGAQDAQTQAVWQAHLARMEGRLAGVRAVPPDLRLSSADPYGLRLGALLLAVLAGLFGQPFGGWGGGLGRAGSAANATASGPLWEAWATPPAYTGKPALYFADQKTDALSLPQGSRIDLRLYGAPGDVIVDETLSRRTDATAIAQPNQSFIAETSGHIRFSGPGARDFAVTILPDTPPQIEARGQVVRRGDTRFALPFTASDDYGVTKGSAQITLDLPRLPRRYGLAVAPDTLPSATLDLPLPRRGGTKTEFSGTLLDDLSKSLLSNMPVTITLAVSDAAGQAGQSAPITATLPGRRFFDPLAAALVELRRDLLWSAQNAPRSAQILKAITYQPDELFRNQRAYLRLRAVIKALDGARAAPLTPALRDTLTDELWQIALLIEEGDLASARDRLTRAQDRLDEAIRKGASPEEIDKLMQDMRRAMQDYMRQLAQEQRERGDEMSQGPGDAPRQTITQDQLSQLMQRLQELMEQGKTAEAAELMQRLRELTQNMRIAEGGPGSGEDMGQGQGGSPSQQALRDLDNTLRDQQRLADDAYRNMQQGGGDAPQDQGDLGQGDLAQRQQNLRDQLDQLQQHGDLPGQDSPQGQAGQQALDDAARAMEQAEQALRQGDLPLALDRQAEALQDLRQGLSQFGQALAQQQRQRAGTELGELGSGQGDETQMARDPLGRQMGTMLRNGSDQNLLQNQEVNRRAEDLLNEIRRRLGEPSRPEAERGYLNRLLDLF